MDRESDPAPGGRQRAFLDEALCRHGLDALARAILHGEPPGGEPLPDMDGEGERWLSQQYRDAAIRAREALRRDPERLRAHGNDGHEQLPEADEDDLRALAALHVAREQ